MLIARIRSGLVPAILALSLMLVAAPPVRSQEAKPAPATKGLRVFTCGHSFHAWIPPILAELAKSAGIADHQMAGLSSIGGSQVIRHWVVPDDKNKAKEVLQAGKVDVLTLSPIYLPDAGIENFATLALKHNSNVRVTVQEFWLPFEMYEKTFTQRPKDVDHNGPTGPQLRKTHEPYFQDMDAHVRELNKKLGKDVLYVVPVGQAVIALREKILAGQAPGLKTQGELFTDAIGHPKAPIQALSGYCHFAVIYGRSPIGLPAPTVLTRGNQPDWSDKLNALLQQLAWDAVIHHPLSGVKP